MTHLTFYPLRSCRPAIALVYFKLHPRNLLVACISGVKTHQPSALVLVVVDGSEVVAEFLVDEVLVVKYFFDVFFGIVIELDNKKITMVRKCLKEMPSEGLEPSREKNL